ncbi:penicillin acylase family protein [Fictibacillus sp. KU28468]|uniref:penicillin acylase family protein n=1 Tax=Fictibacillus sp. KU28468 TaxID=2991053 RepID=UPI0039F6E32E
MQVETAIQIEKQILKKKKWKRVAVIMLAGLLLVTAISGSAAYWILRKSLPVVSGTKTVPSLSGTAVAVRDKNGVPHIKAGSLKDLYTAQGYVTAQDRMFQMDLSRRQASGQLSEVIGEKTVEKDRYFRTLGLRRAAEASYELYSSEAKQVLQWYADGVNAYLRDAEKNNSLPIEFLMVGYKPKKWTPVDSLTIGKYMAFDLGGHWEGQAFRHYLLQNFPKGNALDLFPSYPKGGAEIIDIASKAKVDIKSSLAKAVIPNEFNGSNDWVVAGTKTKSGLPYLADDPHLGLSTPSIWYESHLKAPGMNVSGVIFAGVPGIIVGRNTQIAWGVTNVGPDVQDLYIEKRNSDHPDEFLYEGKWEKAKIITENIKVKDQKTLPYKVTITRHGPIMSEFAYDKQKNTALSMRWTALEPSTELQAVLMFNKAKNWNEFKKALTYFHTPAQNFVFASKEGTIAYRANGLIPIRKEKYASVPVPGWEKKYEWKGYIPWDKLPTAVNPKEGFIATANNKVIGDDYPYHITDSWAQPYREQRIKDVLSAKEKLSVKDMQKLQFDRKNLQAEEMLPILLSHLKTADLGTNGRKAVKLLKDWNHEDDKNLAAPLLFNLWMQEFSDVLFEKKIDEKMMPLFDGKAQVVDELIRKAAEGKEGPWIKEAGGLDKAATISFSRTVKQVEKLQGENPDKWKWGTYHTLPFDHPLSAIKPLNLLFNPKKTPMGGSRVTVGAAGWDSLTGKVNHGAAWRTVVDLADLTKTYNVVGPGQSGHVLSKWYDNQIEDWTTGRYHVTETNESSFKNGEKLVLKPGK